MTKLAVIVRWLTVFWSWQGVMRARAARATILFSSLSIVISISLFSRIASAQSSDDGAAHAIADKFSGAAEERQKAEALKRKAEAERRDAEQRAAEQREIARRKAEEAEMLARAKAEAEERRLADEAASVKAEKARAAEEALAEAKALEDAKAREDAKAKVRAATKAAEERTRTLEAEREAELARLSEKLRLKNEALKHAAETPPAVPAVVPAPPAPAMAPKVEPPVTVAAFPPSPDITVDPDAPAETRVTVLLAMKPSMRGLRKLDSTADPILCLADDCYVSSGADDEAVVMARMSALGIGSPLKIQAGACHDKPGCIFRDVDLKDERAGLQPIDLHFWKHDRREEVETAADRSCRVTAGRLLCDYPIDTPSWQAWVVPESIAQRAGPAALEAAIRSGLTTGPSAALAE